mmetsp:Transcript_37676/g.117089  ORF Transcript_37676/g.117089 Transcript_37676/m.117089 type:complete len:353 (+) Transcript_37676:545-1603(+)
MSSCAAGKTEMRLCTASVAAATRSSDRPSPAMARQSFTRSAATSVGSSGVRATAACRNSSALSWGFSAPLALATARRSRTRSLVAHVLAPTAATLATAPTAGTRLALFVEATANPNSLLGSRSARPSFRASSYVTTVRASELWPRSLIARTTSVRAGAPAAGARAWSRDTTSSMTAPAPPSVHSTCICSSAEGSGCLLSSISKAEVAKLLATSAQEAAPARFTSSRACSIPTSATMGWLRAASTLSELLDPGRRRIRERVFASSLDCPEASCRNTKSATACCVACRVVRRSDAGFAPPTAATRSDTSSKSTNGRAISPPFVVAERMAPRLQSSFFWAVMRSMVLEKSRVSTL